MCKLLPLFNTCMWKCRDEDFIFRTAGLSQYTLVARNAASCLAVGILSDAHPNLGKIPPRIADQGHHVRASIGSNEFLFGNLCALRHFDQCRCRNVRVQCRFEVILLRQTGTSAVLCPLVHPKIIVLGRRWRGLDVGPMLLEPLAAQLIDYSRIECFVGAGGWPRPVVPLRPKSLQEEKCVVIFSKLQQKQISGLRINEACFPRGVIAHAPNSHSLNKSAHGNQINQINSRVSSTPPSTHRWDGGTHQSYPSCARSRTPAGRT